MLQHKLNMVQIDIATLQENLHELKIKETELMISIFKDKNGLDVGDEVTYDGNRGIIESFKRKYSTIRPFVRIYNNDGKLGKQIREVFSFSALEKIEQTTK